MWYNAVNVRNVASCGLLLLCHDLGHGMTDNCASLFNLLLGQSRRHTHLECWGGLPFLFQVFGAGSESVGHGLELGDQHSI
jgi:hypothetical protein